MKKLLVISAVGLFAASVATSAMACGYGKMAKDRSAPITTTLDTQPQTAKPEKPKS